MRDLARTQSRRPLLRNDSHVSPTPLPETRCAEFDRTGKGGWNPGLRQALHLSVEEEDQVLSLLAEQDLRNDEQDLRDAIAHRRSTRDPAALDDEIEKKLEALLGKEGMKQWDEYQAGLPDRRNIIDLRGRLGEVALSDASATQLSKMMREERDRFAAESGELAGGLTSSITAYPERARLNSEDQSARLQFREEQIKRTEGYYARIRERAANLLTAEQMQRLQEMHESDLSTLRASLIRGRALAEEMKKLPQASGAESPK